MYNPSHFQTKDPAVCLALAQAFPLASIVRMTEQGLQADHIPFLISQMEDGSFLLRGHVARANPLWRQEGSCMAIFQAEQGYISPNWYPSKQIDGRQVPTWNYAVAHLHGALQAFDDPVWLRALLDELTNTHESSLPQPWRVADGPAEYIDKLMRAIVGIQIRVTQWECKFKFSQNRSEQDRAGMLQALQQGNPAQQQLALASQRCFDSLA